MNHPLRIIDFSLGLTKQPAVVESRFELGRQSGAGSDITILMALLMAALVEKRRG